MVVHLDLTLEDSGGFGCVIDRNRPDVSYSVAAWANLTVTIMMDEGKNIFKVVQSNLG